MQTIPSPRGFRRTFAYAVVVALAAAILVPFPYPGLAFEVSEVMILVVLVAFLALKYWSLKVYSFDSKGLYKRRRLIFDWRRVKRIGVKFGKGGGSVTLVAPLTWGSVLSGGPIQRETLISYSAALVFSLEDGRIVEVPSNLDRLTGSGVIQSLDEKAKEANPRIEFD